MDQAGGNPAALMAALRNGTFPRRDWDYRARLVACWSNLTEPADRPNLRSNR